MTKPELHIGVVGAGEFATFAANAFLRVSGVRLVAVTDINTKAAENMAKTFNLTAHPDYEHLLNNQAVQLIYIATPPYLHFEQSRMALLAGKHVICEKPAALKINEAEELDKLAHAHQLLWVVNLMQRYNPLYNMVKTIVDDHLLGDFLHGFFENYASDEFLGPDHWFWDPAKSGGIFIEHGVHFFDLFAGWLGVGNVIHALQIPRPDVNELIIDRVQATVNYKAGPVNFYHGFDQPKLLDRQELRLLFERGEITLFEWVPVKMKVHGLVQINELKKLEAMTKTPATVLPSAEKRAWKQAKGRGKNIKFDKYIVLDFENPVGKTELYQQMLTAMLSDQWSWILNPKHSRVIDGKNGVESLRVAVDATGISESPQFK